MKKSIVKIWSLALVGIMTVFLISFLVPLNGIEGTGIGRFLGRFHPLVLHFPIACLSLGVLFELTRPFSKFSYLRKAVGPILVLTAVSACVTAIIGILLGGNEGHAGELIERHRFRGISFSVLVCIVAAIYYTSLIAKKRKIWIGYAISLFASVGLMGLTAHDGGSLVHGPTYLADHAPPFLAPLLITHIPDKGSDIKTGSSKPSVISPDHISRFNSDVGAFFNGYCSRCHGDGKQEANVHLASLDPSFEVFSSQHDWERVLGVLGAHRMPPEKAKQPSDGQREAAMNWIHSALEQYAYARRAEQAGAPLRRLTKRELNHVYQDIFNVDIDFTSRLPADPLSELGYDTDANLLMVSMSDLSLYQDVARDAVEKYVAFGERDEAVDHYFVEMEDVYHYGRQDGDKLSYKRAPHPVAREAIEAIKKRREKATPKYRDRLYGPLPFGPIPNGDVPGVGEGRGFARLHEQFMLLRTKHNKGEVVIRAYAAMKPGASETDSPPRLRLEAGWRNIQSLRAKVIGEHDITAPKENPQVVEFRFQLEEVIAPDTARWYEEGDERWLLLVLSNYARHENGILAGSIYGQIDMDLPASATEATPYLEQAATAAKQQENGLKVWRDGDVPYLLLDAVEATITPVNANANSPWVIAIPSTSADSEMEALEESLKILLPKVYRRSVNAEEFDRYKRLFTTLRDSGNSFEKSFRETLVSALISPHFLYLGHPDSRLSPDNPEDKKIAENLYLASRLSFFLWSSLPDETLQEHAENGRLADPAILASETERMLQDPRSKRFTETFAKQWLHLGKLSDTSISEEIYPEYSPQFAKLTEAETISTVQDNFHNDRDARELFQSSHMILNDQLARHYGVKDVLGGDLRRVETGPTEQRSGLLTQASILAMNSDGEDSHPIKRGVWLLERILFDPPPPPPPSVPELDTNNPELAGLSLKQQIEHHRKLSACSGCHEKIDPWGIAFENFDATGKWRDTVLVSGEQKPVDASSVLPGGRANKSLAELRNYLGKEKERELMMGIVQHLMVYALGRELDVLDEAEAKTIYASFRASGYKLTDLTKAIVQSDAFTNRNTSSAQMRNGH